MATLQEWMASRGAAIVVASFATPERLREYQRAFGFLFPLYADPARNVYRKLQLGRHSLWRLLSPRVLARYWELLRKGRRLQRGGGDDVFQGGGDFFILPDGRIPFAYRSDDPADRPSLAVVREAVERSTAPPP